VSAEQAIAHVRALSRGRVVDSSLRITVNFHPDWPVGRRTVLEALAAEGVYRSQFVTRTSNGGLTAHLGGDRWRWESRMFGGADDEGPAEARPVYGALNFRRKSVGGAPRFGSAHLRLTASALERATFCYPDSCLEPAHFGVSDRMSLIEPAETDDQDDLDDYVEAQVHGLLSLEHDVEAVVLDPSHQGTAVGDAAAVLPCPVEWHAGFRLAVSQMQRHPDYGGQQYVDLGCHLAVDGILTPRVIGDAARTERHEPQELKRVWYYLARFGAP
jgi:hypothetical protein